MIALRGCCLILALAFAGCSDKKAPAVIKNESITNCKYAERFSLEKQEGCTILKVKNPWQGAEGVEHVWYLLEDGGKLPAGADTGRVIHVPLQSIVCMSTTYLPMIQALGKDATIRAISGYKLLYNENLRKSVEKGEIADIGYEDNLNKELLIKISPDLVMTYGVGSEASGYMVKVRDLGLKVMFNADYLEQDPLGKAEWIKVFGALYCLGEKADSIFDSIDSLYNDTRKIILDRATFKPKVLLGLPWKDTWFISPGNSFSGRLIEDAGGEYLWKETLSDMSMPMGVENVWFKARNADYWLNPGAANTISEITTIDPRLGELKVVTEGNIYNNNNRITEFGGNDYWESGSVAPHIILMDLASILHPEIFPDYIPYYYKKLTKQN